MIKRQTKAVVIQAKGAEVPRILERITYIAELLFLNPVLFFKKFIGKMLIKFAPAPEGEASAKIGDYTIIVWPSRNNWWKSIYFGYCGVEIEQNLKRYLHKSEIFIDVGAGIGYFSAIASKIVGSVGQVHCFEPNPSSSQAIQRMINSNPNSNIILNDCALGIDDSVHNYYIQRFNERTAVSMVDSFIEKVEEVMEVRTQRLDTYLEQNRIDEVSLIKIDVEGYEYFVLKGLEGFFRRSKKNLPPLIVEITPLVYGSLSYSLRELQCYMGDYGYQAYNIFNPNRKEDMRLIRGSKDVIFQAVK